MITNIPSHSIINIAIVLLATFLIGKTIINLSMARRKTKKISSLNKKNLYAIEIIRVLIFFKLFANCLVIPFFPQFLTKITVASHLPATFASIAFIVYQLFAFMMLLPSGFLAEFTQAKKTLALTTFIQSLLVLGFSLATNFWEILTIQIIFGCLVPISTALEYSYAFQLSSEKNRNHTIALYSNTIQGAMISGIIIGGILSTYISTTIVFLISSSIIFLFTFYVLIYVPNIKISSHQPISQKINLPSAIKNLPLALKNIHFIKVSSLIGLPLGLLCEGIVFFGLPIMMSHRHIPHDQIAQMLILFTIGFFITNKIISKKADRFNNENKFLCFGLLGIAAGLFILTIPYYPIITLAIGLTLLGLFRGFITSPAIAYISKSPVTLSIGKNVTFSIYNIFETSGKIIGPLIIAQLFTLTNYSTFVFAITGISFILFAFILGYRTKAQL